MVQNFDLDEKTVGDNRKKFVFVPVTDLQFDYVKRDEMDRTDEKVVVVTDQ